MSKGINALVIDGESVHALNVARSLGESDTIKVHVLSSLAYAPIKFSRHISSFVARDGALSDETLLDLICKIAKDNNIDVAIPAGEEGVRFISKHYDSLSKVAKLQVSPDVSMFDTLQDKWKAFNYYTEHGIKTPKSILCNDNDDFRKSVKYFRSPVLIKPRIGYAGEGIIEFSSTEELTRHVGTLKEEATKFIAQEKIDGELIDSSIISKSGKILSYTIQKPFQPASVKFAAPRVIRFLDDEKVLALTTKVILKTGWSGVANLDIIRSSDTDDLYLLEVNPRYWATLLGSSSVGINFPQLAVKEALGHPVETSEYKKELYQPWFSYLKLKFKRHPMAKDMGSFFGNTSFKYQGMDPIPSAVSFLKSRTEKMVNQILPGTFSN